MANANVSRLGQINAAGDTDALFLKVSAGEVLSAFGRESAFRQRHTVRTIPNGKSATFPVTGRASAAYHIPGDEITGGVIKANERVIVVDDLLIAPTFIANIDEAKNYYDVRSIYTGEIGQILAKTYDYAVGSVGILAARSAGVVDGIPGGGHDNNASYDNDGTVIYKGIWDAGTTLDLNDVPANNRSAFVRPLQYALVVQSGEAIDRDYSMGAEDNGSRAVGNINRINSIQIVKTNNLPHIDERANLLLPASRRADYSVTRALVAGQDAMGTVQLQDVTMEMGYDMRRQGTLMLGKYLVGHGPLRAESAFELRTGDPSA